MNIDTQSEHILWVLRVLCILPLLTFATIGWMPYWYSRLTSKGGRAERTCTAEEGVGLGCGLRWMTPEPAASSLCSEQTGGQMREWGTEWEAHHGLWAVTQELLKAVKWVQCGNFPIGFHYGTFFFVWQQLHLHLKKTEMWVKFLWPNSHPKTGVVVITRTWITNPLSLCPSLLLFPPCCQASQCSVYTVRSV